MDTELEFENVSPQIQIFSFLFNDFLNSISWPVNDFTKAIFRDIFLNLINGNYKYRISKFLTQELNPEDIILYFKELIEDLLLNVFHINSFQDYEKIDFNEIEFYLVFQKYKSGFCFNFKCPESNEIIKDLVEKENNNLLY